MRSAGSTVVLAMKATIMPTPAIRPSSETPRYTVGTKARKPQAVAVAAQASGRPALSDAVLSERKRTLSAYPPAPERTLELKAETAPKPMDNTAEGNGIR